MAPISRVPCALLAVAGLTFVANAQWDHSLYASSPPVFPSPEISGAGGWEDSLEKARAFVANLTVEEKSDMVTGAPGPCAGNIIPVPRLGFKGLCLQDGPAGIRQAIYASVYPAGVAAGASWDRGLIHARSLYMGEEFRAKGAHIALTPVAGGLGRSPYGGRNWEGFSPDPYLAGIATAESVRGLQDAGVQATSKHFIGNEQETQRNPTTVNGTRIEAISSNIDDRTMHELYLWPFADAIHAGSASVMCSYQRINGSYGCQNSKTLNGLLKGELGFQGYVMSDWLATHSGVLAIESGLDMDMPGKVSFVPTETASYFGANITTAINNGTLDEARLDDMILRILAPYFHLKQDQDFPPTDESSASVNFFPANEEVDFTLGPVVEARKDAHTALIRELGAAGTVLLKNENNALPLDAPKNIAVFGNDASDSEYGLYFLGVGGSTFDGLGVQQGTLAAGGGSGTGRFTYLTTPLEALKAKAKEDSALLQFALDNEYISNGGITTLLAPSPPDVCLVFLKAWATEGVDRFDLSLQWNSTAVVDAVTATCNNTVVVMHNPGPVTIPFASNPNVTAILAAHYPGQESGNSIVDILYGNINPSAHLPYSIAFEEADYSRFLTNSSELAASTDPYAWHADFTEGQLIDYREFDAQNKSVLYEFGFGLSYTTFGIDALEIEYHQDAPVSRTPSPDAPIIPGGNAELWDVLATVTAVVENTGDVFGKTVPQLYLSLPESAGEGTPVRVLRGFEKVGLEPGANATVSFPLRRRDVSYWDVVSQQWTVPEGAIGVQVGFSSRDLPLQSQIEL